MHSTYSIYDYMVSLYNRKSLANFAHIKYFNDKSQDILIERLTASRFLVFWKQII